MDEIFDREVNELIIELEFQYSKKNIKLTEENKSDLKKFLIDYLKVDTENRIFEKEMELGKRIKKLINFCKEKGLPYPRRFGN